jgi:hypothetical protein
MKSISISKHARRRASTVLSTINLSEANAAFSDGCGFRVFGYDREGRRFTVSLDAQLIDDLAAMRARHPAVTK